MNAPRITPARILQALRQGQAVDLEAPGWSDTGAALCPDCQAQVRTFTRAPDVLFHYGLQVAYPHRCGLGDPITSRDRKAQRLERLHAEIDALARDQAWEHLQTTGRF